MDEFRAEERDVSIRTQRRLHKATLESGGTALEHERRARRSADGSGSNGTGQWDNGDITANGRDKNRR